MYWFLDTLVLTRYTRLSLVSRKKEVWFSEDMSMVKNCVL